MMDEVATTASQPKTAAEIKRAQKAKAECERRAKKRAEDPEEYRAEHAKAQREHRAKKNAAAAACIYAIKCLEGSEVYVGSTMVPVGRRFTMHLAAARAGARCIVLLFVGPGRRVWFSGAAFG